MTDEIPARAKPVGLLILDVDGTVREGKDDPLGRFVNGPEDVRVFPAAVAKMHEWKEQGGRIIGVSNQGGVALGLVSSDRVAAAMLETQRQCKGLFDRIAWCEHHPDAKDPMQAACWCRKPAPGLVIETTLYMSSALRHSNGVRSVGEAYPVHLAQFVGDREEDRKCAESINIPFMWAWQWRGETRS